MQRPGTERTDQNLSLAGLSLDISVLKHTQHYPPSSRVWHALLGEQQSSPLQRPWDMWLQASAGLCLWEKTQVHRAQTRRSGHPLAPCCTDNPGTGDSTKHTSPPAPVWAMGWGESCSSVSTSFSHIGGMPAKHQETTGAHRARSGEKLAFNSSKQQQWSSTCFADPAAPMFRANRGDQAELKAWFSASQNNVPAVQPYKGKAGKEIKVRSVFPT